MVSPENRAYITPRGNDSALVRSLTVLTEQAQVRTELGRVNRLRCVEQYDLQLMVRRYRSLYSEVLTGVPARDSVVP
jgi:hypothetical protein